MCADVEINAVKSLLETAVGESNYKDTLACDVVTALEHETDSEVDEVVFDTSLCILTIKYKGGIKRSYNVEVTPRK